MHDAVIEVVRQGGHPGERGRHDQEDATLEFDEADWSKIVETNLTGTMRACQIFGRRWSKARIWAHHQYCVVDGVSRVLSGSALCGEQERCSLADQDAGDRAGQTGVNVNAIAPWTVSHEMSLPLVKARHAVRRS
jgi:NADP-dependent 3-hydroxy acid dehydrogenase YdfG